MPIGGVNLVDPLAAMPITESPNVHNLFPYYGGLANRPYFTLVADTISGFVAGEAMSLMSWTDPTGVTSPILLLGTDSNIYTMGTPAVSKQSGLNDGHYRWANLGGYLGMVNESASDGPMTFDGASVAAMTMSGTSPYTVNQMSGLMLHKARSWFWAYHSNDLYYSAVDTLGGVLTRFPLSSYNNRGGYIVDVATWTRDGGSGMDDYFVILFSTGMVIIYQGTDPASASTWSMVGIYQIPRPSERNAMMKYGGDLMVMTEAGYMLLSAVLENTNTDNATISKKINPTVIYYFSLTDGSKEGWKSAIWNNLLIVLPGLANPMHIMDMNTGAWFTWDIHSDTTVLSGYDILVHEGILYAVGYESLGAVAEVHKFGSLNTGTRCGSGGFYIPWSYFEAPGRQKRVTAVRPNYAPTSGGITGYLEMLTDFNYSPYGYVSSTFINGRFVSRTGAGSPVSLYFINTYTTSAVPIYSFDIMYELGGFL